jgi:hypothetical protein
MNAADILARLTVAELRPLAAEAGVAGRSRMRKAELVAALAEAPLIRSLAEALVIADQRAGDYGNATPTTREGWLTLAAEVVSEDGLDGPGEDLLSDAYRVVLGLVPPAQFRLLYSSVRGDDFPGSDTFASLAEAEAHVRRELTSLSSIWRVRVLDAAGQVVRLAVRSGYNASGRGWVWATPLSALS